MSIEYPLNEIYGRNDRVLPELIPLAGTQMPQPYRGLLVHQRDMTPTLMHFHKSQICIEALQSWRQIVMYYYVRFFFTVKKQGVLCFMVGLK